ncbi:unnamed protein product, partial [Amoebophrya sp. A120]
SGVANSQFDKLPDLAIACDHSVFVIKRSGTLEMSFVAGNISEYGYKDAAKGSDARFSQIRGICSIRNSVFVADHWNNAVRCINLKTTGVDTVMDFEPNGPLKLTASDSGYLYVLDSDTIHMCNILKICSVQRENLSTSGVNGSSLGTLSFQNLQKQTLSGIGNHAAGASNTRSSIGGAAGGPVPPTTGAVSTASPAVGGGVSKGTLLG